MARVEQMALAFGAISIVFIYTTITNIVERPDGIKIASFFIFAIIAASFISRVMRSTEIRIDKIELDATAQAFIDELRSEGEIRIVTNRRETGDMSEYRFKEHEKRIDNHIPSTDPIVFYEIETGDASEFKGRLKICGTDIGGYKILRTQAPAFRMRSQRSSCICGTRPARYPTFIWLERREIRSCTSPLYLAR
jgi:hypothetical protein